MLSSVIAILLLRGSAAAVLDFGSMGGKPDDSSLSAALANQALLNQILNQLAPGDTFVLPGAATWHTMGGVVVSDLTDVVLSFDGILKFSGHIDDWPPVYAATLVGIRSTPLTMLELTLCARRPPAEQGRTRGTRSAESCRAWTFIGAATSR